jgi:hypothetical protein
MENIDFENNIKEAFKRLNRDKLKAKMTKIDNDLSSDELLFESNIAEASKRIERDRMKAILQKTEIESKGKVVSLKSTWWSYAAAACLVIGVASILIFQSRDNEPVLSNNDIKKEQPKTQNEETPIIENNNEIVKKDEQKIRLKEFYLPIKSENLGFSGVDKINGIIVIDKTKRKTITYNYVDNKLTLTSSEALKIKSAINLDDNLYFKINNAFYLIKPNKENQALEAISDNELIEKLEKIDFTNADN